ncbi:MAG: DUF2436 domain-containing protein [Bacteroidales bacterium]|nr:DUF2436 domain-containing protein [Bacteroidales bacterium]
MKKTLFFLSLIMCFAIVNAQNVNVSQLRKHSVNSEQKQIVNPNHVPTTFKVVNGAKTPIPAGFARVTLTAGDVWGDGSGYQMLIDSNATAFGVEIPTTGPLTTGGDATASTYAAFEWKIPTNADGSMSTTNIVMNSTITIEIPAGTYDYCITNPTPGDRIWIAGGENSRADNFTFLDGVEYTFTVALAGSYDATTITMVAPNDVALSNLVVPAQGILTNAETITVTVSNLGTNTADNIPLSCIVYSNVGNPVNSTTTIPTLAPGATTTATFTADMSTIGASYTVIIFNEWTLDQNNLNDSVGASTACIPNASLTYDFNSGVLPADWTTLNIDGNTPDVNINALFPTNAGWEVAEMEEGDYVAIAPSWFSPAGQADRWLISSRINLQGNNFLQFDYASIDPNYPESMEIKISNGGTQPADFTTLESVASVPAYEIGKTINLSAFTGTVRVAFRLTSMDAFIGMVDNVKILGNALSLNEVENNVSFGVYPNPANDFVTISDANGAEVRILDMFGRTLISKSVKSSNETISIDNLNNGMYMIQIVKDGKASTQKLIKK